MVITQFDLVSADSSYSEPSVKMISSETMSGMQSGSMSGMSSMSNNMSGMQSGSMSGMSSMSNNMSGMQSGSVQGMSGMKGMSGMLGISSNEEISIFLEWMFALTIVLIGVPFAWVFLRERRKKKSNQTNAAPKPDVDKI